MYHSKKTLKSLGTVFSVFALMFLTFAIVSCGGDEPTTQTQATASSTATDTVDDDYYADDDDAVEIVFDPKKAGSITGTISFTGKAPTRLDIDITESVCAAKHEGKPKDESVIVTEGKLANVLVYIKKINAKADPQKAPTLNQNGCVYSPHVIAVMQDQKFTVKNGDATAHNINFSPNRNEKLNFGQPKEGDTKDVSFSKAEIGIPVKCDVHPWMGAVVHVMKNPFYAVSAADGTFTINGVPPGKYEIRAWHEKFKEQALKDVAVKESGAAKADFTFK